MAISMIGFQAEEPEKYASMMAELIDGTAQLQNKFHVSAAEINDIAFSDSHGKAFYAIPDGSYLFIGDGKEELRGEAYRISDGNMLQVAKVNDILKL